MSEGKGIVKAARDVRQHPMHRGATSKLRWRDRLRVEIWARYGRRVDARQERRQKAVQVAAAYDARFGGPAEALHKLVAVDEDLLGPGPRARRRAAEYEQRQAAQREADERAREVGAGEYLTSLSSHGYTTPGDA